MLGWYDDKSFEKKAIILSNLIAQDGEAIDEELLITWIKYIKDLVSDLPTQHVINIEWVESAFKI